MVLRLHVVIAQILHVLLVILVCQLVQLHDASISPLLGLLLHALHFALPALLPVGLDPVELVIADLAVEGAERLDSVLDYLLAEMPCELVN